MYAGQMLFHRIVLSLALFTASVSSAQAPEDGPLAGARDTASLLAPVAPQPEMQEPGQAVPEGESIPSRYRPENEAPPDHLLPRVLVEAVGGVLGGAVMGLAGFLTGAPALRNVSCTSGEVCIAPLVLIMIPAAFVGIPVSVQHFAEPWGGRGEFLPALGGSLLGTGAGFISGLSSGSTGGLIASLIIGPITGAILGYEISHALNKRRASAAGAMSSAKAGPRVVPVIGATPRGGFLGGFAGSF
jgi:hypothetical protein